MSRSRSVSLEIVPPNTNNSMGLAAVLDAVFQNNSKQNGDDSKGLEDAEADLEEDPPAPQSNTNSAAAVGFPPTPCERCVRTKKTCKGIAGARCEYCKRLKQKCSNSTGPARGKHAIPKQPKLAAPSTSKPVPAAAAGSSDSTKWQDRSKRKGPEKPSASQNGNTDDGEGSDDEENAQQNANKKRRLSKSGPGSGSRFLLVKAVADMEASIKRVQSSVAKEVEKMNGIVKLLNAKIDEMDDD